MSRQPARLLISLTVLALLVAVVPPAVLAANLSPAQPTITEPATDGQVVNPADVHMETGPFDDPDGGSHLCTDWVIEVASTSEVAWQSLCSPILLHIHLGDGSFVNSYAGKSELNFNTDYVLRARHSDDSGDPASQWSPWAQRPFHTSVAPAPGGPVAWTLRQSGFQVAVVASGFQLPVNIAFLPNPGTSPNSPYYYVAELYGNIRVVSRNGTVSDYIRGALNYQPSGRFPGSGEQGLAGIVVDPASGDVFASLLYVATNGGLYAKVLRFRSNHGGAVAGSYSTILEIHEQMSASHQISNLTIGPDGKLYVHVGDGMVPSTAQDLGSFRGKILRLNFDGTAPSDNPFYDASNGITARDYVFAYGFRNPFGGVWRPADGKHYEVENGPSVDRFAQIVRGRNYLWNGTDTSMQNYAIYNWSPAAAPVNIAFVDPAVFGGSGFPASKLGHAFVSESGSTYATGPQTRGKRISEFVIDTNGNLVSGPTSLLEYTGTGKGTAVALAAGPDGLYFSDLYKDLNYSSPIDVGAKIYRIARDTSPDTSPPTVTAPANRFYASTVNQTSPQLPVRISWSAADPGGIASTQLQQSVNGATYSTITLTSATSWTFRAPSSSTTTYRFRDRATDGAGNTSAYATGPTFRVGAYQETTPSPTLVFTSAWKTWNDPGYFGGSARYAGAAGQKATFKFSGTDFALVATKAPNRGKFQLYLDGVAGPIVDLYLATWANRQVVGIGHFSTAGPHTVEIRVLGQKNSASTGTRIDFDAALTMSP